MIKKVEIVEVGLRDGLQNEKIIVPADIRVEAARRLALAGIKKIEAGAFVRSDKIPQMNGSKEIFIEILAQQKNGMIPKSAAFPALVPNLKGMQDALQAGATEVAVFASATESFSKANINCSIEESFSRFVEIFPLAKKNKVKVRGYLSVCFGCPYEGNVSEQKVITLAKKLYQMGCYEISIGDTIGVADPRQVEKMFSKLSKVVPVKKIAGHFHDTRGTALANILKSAQMGVQVFDTSIGGLGGCPYAPGSAGNVATEDVLYMFEKMGVKTGIDLSKYIAVNKWFSEKIGKELSSKVSKAGLLKR